MIQVRYGIRRQMLRNGFDHIVRNIPAGGQAVNGIGIHRKLLDRCGRLIVIAEGIALDGSQGAGQGQIHQGFAEVEGIVSDGGDADAQIAHQEGATDKPPRSPHQLHRMQQETLRVDGELDGVVDQCK